MAIELVLVTNVLQGEIQNWKARKSNAIRCRSRKEGGTMVKTSLSECAKECWQRQVSTSLQVKNE
jgi:hypothetical protein